MMDRRGCCAREPGGEVRRARGKRIRDGGIIFCASLLLALLGVPWGVPLALVVFGAALLLAMAMAALFERGSPGALGGRWLALAPILGGLVAGALVLSLPREGASVALVEVFAPAGAGVPAEGGHADALAREAAAASERSPAVWWIEHDLEDAFARERLGRLAGWSRPLTEEEARSLSSSAIFVSGQPLSSLERIEDAIRRESSRERSQEHPVVDAAGIAAGSIRISVRAPRDIEYLLLLLAPAGDRGATPEGAAERWKVRSALRDAPPRAGPPDRDSSAEPGEEPTARRELVFDLEEGMADPRGLTPLLLAERAGRVLGAWPLDLRRD